MVTNEQDVGADFLVRELGDRGVRVVRLNAERAPTWKLALRPGERWHCRGSTRELGSDDCLGVWWRRPEVPATPEGADAAAEAIADQWRSFLAALATVPGPVWVSDPADIRRAEGKALQLKLAAGLGLSLPNTLWTNDADAARAFLARCGDEAVVKSVASAWWESGETGYFVFASAVETADLPAPTRLAAAPVCFQGRIHPKRDVRVTVVGEAVHAAVRDAPPTETEPLDWRLGGRRDWTAYELPVEVAAACRELVRTLGLRFGGVDLAVDQTGQHWFLELNPNGEWGWLQWAGLPIAAALADVLTGAP